MQSRPRITVGADGATIWVKGLGQFTERIRAATTLYDALRDWLVQERLVDAGTLPLGTLHFAPAGARTTLTVRGIPIGRMADGTLELFLPPYVRGAMALRAAREMATVLRGSGWAEHPIVQTGGSDAKQPAA
jgi:hypothetical protein